MSTEVSRAASLLLLRDSPAGPQLLLTRRASGLRNWADNWVFPGGREEPFDRHPAATATDPPSPLCTAVRETFEETGALLATIADSAMRPQAVASLRASPAAQFFQVLQQYGASLDDSAILPWAHWIAPQELQRRFDTRFFIATLPSGDGLQPDGRETLELTWWSPGEAVAAARSDQVRFAPPTVLNLIELQQCAAGCGTVQQVLERARRREFITIFPRVVVDDGRRWGLYPWDPQYATTAPGGTAVHIPARYYELPSRLPLPSV